MSYILGVKTGESLEKKFKRTQMRIAGNLTNEFELRSWRQEAARGLKTGLKTQSEKRDDASRQARASLAWSPSLRTDHPVLHVPSTWRCTSFGSSCSLLAILELVQYGLHNDTWRVDRIGTVLLLPMLVLRMWKKSSFHARIHPSLYYNSVDLSAYFQQPFSCAMKSSNCLSALVLLNKTSGESLRFMEAYQES